MLLLECISKTLKKCHWNLNATKIKMLIKLELQLEQTMRSQGILNNQFILNMALAKKVTVYKSWSSLKNVSHPLTTGLLGDLVQESRQDLNIFTHFIFMSMFISKTFRKYNLFLKTSAVFKGSATQNIFTLQSFFF